MNKPIPAIIRFHKRFLSEWVFEENQPLWKKEAPNPKEVIDFLNAELLNERERIIAETDFETMTLATQLMWDTDKIEQIDDENKRDCMEAHNHALQRIYNLLSSKHRVELKEGGE